MDESSNHFFGLKDAAKLGNNAQQRRGDDQIRMATERSMVELFGSPKVFRFNSEISSTNENFPSPSMILKGDNDPKILYTKPDFLSSAASKVQRYDTSFLDLSNFSPGCIVCQMQFKHVYRDYVISNQLFSQNQIEIGSFLIVKSHINPYLIDLGIVTALYSKDQFLEMKSFIGRSEDEEENFIGLVLRVANTKERQKLRVKLERETEALEAAQQIVLELRLQMKLYEAEYQFDGRILFLYYTADSRVDYRELVFQMVNACDNTRVKMKKTNQCRKFVPQKFAAIGLATGQLPVMM